MVNLEIAGELEQGHGDGSLDEARDSVRQSSGTTAATKIPSWCELAKRGAKRQFDSR
jgi:hypothetical protein